MTAENAGLRARITILRTEPILRRHQQIKVDRRHALQSAKSGRAASLAPIDLMVEHVGVACVKQPSMRSRDGNAGMPPRVSGEGDHQDLGREAVQISNYLEVEPARAGPVVDTPVLHVVPL